MFAILVVVGACDNPRPSPAHVPASTPKQWALPDRLKEISGLTLTADGRLLGHDDEHGIVYELDHHAGKIGDEWAIGRMPPQDDFEGIASIGDTVYLITSTGTLYQTPLGGGRFERVETGAGEACEIEGLTARGATLVAVCKRIFDGPKDHIRLLFLDDTLAVARTLDIPVATRTRPSGVEWSAERAEFLVVAADPGAVYRVTADGQLLATVELDRKRHRQAEGITLTREGHMIIADEGGQKKARLTVYRTPP